MSDSLDIRVFGLEPDSIVDGPGLRYAVFVQGCSHHCEGCHNPGSWAAQGGSATTTAAIMEEIAANPLVEGVTLSGGEPFEQAQACAVLARESKALGKNVWAYSGYIYEDLQRAATHSQDASVAQHVGALPVESWQALDAEGVAALLETIDVLVDGPYVDNMHSYELKWRGSANQRLIDMKATRAQGKVVLWEPYGFVPQIPSNW
ncbi:MAG: 4Fe-4S cluster-binding domain-containing protein [Coriobacteriia bacterium]|nr:4Fe-4S cluster-binding domain-containing protein [Coriobacteriia bacterium]